MGQGVIVVPHGGAAPPGMVEIGTCIRSICLDPWTFFCASDSKKLKSGCCLTGADPSLMIRVICANKMFFADVDAPKEIVSVWRLSLENRKKFEDENLKNVAAYCSGNRDMLVRVYRTAKGLRYLNSSFEIDPLSEFSDKSLEAFGADEVYRQLCVKYKAYRARVEPKPWRVKRAKLKDPNAKFRTCQLIDIIGSGQQNPAFDFLIKTHDDYSLALDQNDELVLA